MSEPRSLRVIAVGDLSLNGRYLRWAEHGQAARPFERVAALWRVADVRLGNLEAPLTTAPRAAHNKMALRASPRSVEALRDAGFDCLALANNHAMDYGPAGLDETRAHLTEAGIPVVGAGENESAARAPVILEKNGQTLGLLAFCSVEQESHLYAGPCSAGVAALDDEEECLARVRALRPHVDHVVVQLHWGQEQAQLPTPMQRALARRFVAAGVDAILGHHPHVLQPLEVIDGVPVFYSLGNSVFSSMYWRGRHPDGERYAALFRLHPLSRRTGWAELVLQPGARAEARLVPARLRRDGRLTLDDTIRRRREWDRLCRQLDAPEYADGVAQEARRALERLHWQTAWSSLPRRLELFLFRCGLLPGAVEGT